MDYSKLTIEEINKALNSLQIVVESHIMSSADAKKHKELLMTAKEQKILATFPIRVWEASNGTWKAHVPDNTKERNRKTLQGKTKEHLENNILKDYQERFDDRLIFSNYFANWLVNYKAMLVKEPTIHRILTDYKKFIQGTTLDKMKVTDIKRKDVKNLLNDVINKYHLTRNALNNLKSIFNGIFAYAIDQEDISVNPMFQLNIENTNIAPEKLKDSETEIFNEDELDVIVDYMYQHYLEYKPILTLAILLNFQLGLRVGELCTLKKSDVNFNDNTIKIHRMERSYRPIRLENGQIIEEKTIHELVEGNTKKGSNRIIDLSDEALTIIKRTLELQEESSITSSFLFPDENGNYNIRQRFNECLEYYCKKVAIDCKSSHKIRKTVFTNLFSHGFDIEEVMKIAGHRQKTTTLQYYLFSKNRKEDRRTRMNDALASKHCAF